MDRENVIKDLEEYRNREFVKEGITIFDADPRYRKLIINNAISLLKEQNAVKPQDAEMLIIHNDGSEEYVKDIESIVLLAHKDYDIVYCGKFSEGAKLNEQLP